MASHRSLLPQLFLIIVLLLGGCSLLTPPTPTQTPNTSIAIHPTQLTSPISPAFAGFSAETANVCRIHSLDSQTPAFAQLFKNLGSATLRIGGDTVDSTSWSPNGSSSCLWSNTVLNKTSIDNIFAFAQKVGWKITWGVNLKQFHPYTFANEAAYANSSGASSLLAIEFGNEPEFFPLTYTQFHSKWDAYYQALTALVSHPSLSGPATSTTSWLSSFVTNEASKLRFASRHYYIRCVDTPPTPTITDLLSPQTMASAVSMFKESVKAAKAQHLPLVLNETNNYCNGGAPGVSNVFAAALWGADYMLTAANIGVTRLNFHGIPNNPSGNSSGTLNYYSPINDDGRPAPLYYAMLLFHYAAANGTTANTQITSSINVAAHSIVGTDGKLRVVIINKDQAHTATVQINTTQAYTSATAISLLAPSISAKTGITLGGSAVAPDGTWTPQTFEPVPVHGSMSSISLPAASAVVITYQ